MDVLQLQLLRELGERGSLAAVAKAQRVTPSAVSQQLSSLQRSIRTPLTRRDGRRLVLTPAGQALARAAVDVSTALDRARRAVDDYVDEPTSPVSISAFHSAGLAYFGPLLRVLAAQGGPPLRCADADVAQDQFPALVADYDLVLAHRLDHSPPWPDDLLSVLPLTYEPILVAMAADHRLAGKERLTAADVADEEWISVHDGWPLEGTLSAIAAAAHRPLTIVHRINEFFLAASMVASGTAIALLPRETSRPEPGVVLRPLVDLRAGRHIDVLARPEALARASVQRVLAALTSVATEAAHRARRAPAR